MITIKSAMYTDDEKEPLYNALQAAIDSFINNNCEPQTPCSQCRYRHVCYDLSSARDYAYQIMTEG